MSMVENNINYSWVKDEKLQVKLGDMVFTQYPERYQLLGIGTCLGIFMYDVRKAQYAIAHTVLPKMPQNYELDPKYQQDLQKMPAKFTDLAINLMLKKLMAAKCSKSDIKCKIVGGGQIFSDSFKIGKGNIETAHESLNEKGIPIKAEDLGGRTSRSILVFNKDGSIDLRKDGNYFSI
ncbi:MAG: chemotaxis protein CheD [Promethearchaeota archaeon]